jgi:hypothetical protein
VVGVGMTEPGIDALAAHWKWSPRNAAMSVFDEDEDAWHPTATVTAVRGPYLDFVDCNGNWGRRLAKDCRPDLDDDATCGCLLGLVRDAWGPDYSVMFNPEGVVELAHIPTANFRYFEGASGGRALAAALLAALPKTGEP